MTSWSSEMLEPGYGRALVGFDFRSLPVPKLQLLKSQNAGNSVKAECAATIDPELWKRPNNAKYDAERNGFNLIDQTSHELFEGRGFPKCMLIAFDIPLALFEELARTFGLRSLEINRLIQQPHWEFLGFDVADIRTQSSALYSLDLPNTLQQKLRGIPDSLNRWGLLDQESEAISLCAQFDTVISDHAPFAPCGVWSAKQSKGPG